MRVPHDGSLKDQCVIDHVRHYQRRMRRHVCRQQPEVHADLALVAACMVLDVATAFMASKCGENGRPQNLSYAATRVLQRATKRGCMAMKTSGRFETWPKHNLQVLKAYAMCSLRTNVGVRCLCCMQTVSDHMGCGFGNTGQNNNATKL